MAKKALCVGINDYPYDGSDLNGCINDAMGWAELLVGHYDFPASDVRLMLDAEATKANILAALKNLLAGAKSGDVLVFTNASHGTYIADTSGDEPRYDEAICPYDCATNLIVDDELRELFTGLTKGVHLVVISDSCFSGTVTASRWARTCPASSCRMTGGCASLTRRSWGGLFWRTRGRPSPRASRSIPSRKWWRCC